MTRRILRAGLLVAFVALLVAPATAGAINPVSFSQVGDLTTPRDFPGGARLPDGRVLIAGGCGMGAASCLDTAEIFDPATNTFSSAGVGTMSSKRWGPATAALPDGRVLVAGGWDGSVDIASADVFDPTTQTFSPVGPLGVPREAAATAPLPDGRVLVAGGFSNAAHEVSSTEIFDPKTNTFSPGPPMPEAKYGAPGVVIVGGRILIAGGYANDYLSSAAIFDPAGNAFTVAPSLPFPAYAPAGASLPQGRALIAGGANESGGPRDEVTTALIFDPTTNAFSSQGIGNLIHKREEAAGVELKDGRVLVAGGWDGGPIKTAEVLSVPSNAFKAKLKGRKVKFTVTNEGVAQVTDVSTKLATTAKKKKKPKLVKTTSKHGGPGTIVVKIKLTKQGSAKLRQKGRLKVRIAYTPDQGLAATKKIKLRAGK